MKKILILVMTMLIATAAFASNDVTLRLGGAYDLLTTTTPRSIIFDNFDNEITSFNGFGFDIGVDFDLTTDLQFYLDFSMPFPATITIGDNVESKADVSEELKTCIESIEEQESFEKATGEVLYSAITIHVGFAKIFNLEGSGLKFTVGGGFGLVTASLGYKASAIKLPPETEELPCKKVYYASYQSFTNMSLDLKLGARYSVGNRFAVYGILSPALTFFNINKEFYHHKVEYEKSISPSNENTGFAAGFNLAVRLGVSYTF